MLHGTWRLSLLSAALWNCAFVAVPAEDTPKVPPWTGQYKIKATDTARLTAADFVGPDGMAYPNWTRCGVQGGIPEVPVVNKIEDFGGQADDGKDDSDALSHACEAAGKKGGGAVLLGKGTYHLDMPVNVRHNGVVIRGLGAKQTRVIFRFGLPPAGIGFYALRSGDRVGKSTPLTLQCRATGVQTMEIAVNGKVVHTWQRSKHSGNTFSTGISAQTAFGKLPAGSHTLRGVAHYADGRSLTVELPVVYEPNSKSAAPPSWEAAILFTGNGLTGKPIKLARDAARGTRDLVLESTEGLAAGDKIFIDAPATSRWNQLVRNACLWGRYRQYELEIEKVDKATVRVSQPLRIDFPVIDESYVRKLSPIERCGAEDFYLEQTEDLWISSVVFKYGWNCWARGVTVKKCGRFPVYGSHAKWCEVRNCTFDDAWFKGGGGTAYSGWDGCWDCLMDGCETYKLRHAPLFQWAAAGNVIRKSVFHDSDAQWHSGWTHENLIEQCVIESVKGNGGYGFGMWASPPEDAAHGPNGPRNVVYNCDVTSPKTGLWMGGMNENWLIVYNRFRVGSGPGVFAKTASFDHIIRGNVFVLEDRKSPLLQLATPDCIGVELLGNTLCGGNGKLTTEGPQPALVKNNTVLDLERIPPLPTAPSIYEYQLQQMRHKAARAK